MMMAPRRCEHAPLLACFPCLQHCIASSDRRPPFSFLRILVSLVGLPAGEATCSRVRVKLVLRAVIAPRASYRRPHEEPALSIRLLSRVGSSQLVSALVDKKTSRQSIRYFVLAAILRGVIIQIARALSRVMKRLSSGTREHTSIN